MFRIEVSLEKGLCVRSFLDVRNKTESSPRKFAVHTRISRFFVTSQMRFYANSGGLKGTISELGR